MSQAETKRLAHYVRDYKNNIRDNRRNELQYYKQLAALDEVINVAALARTPRGKRHPHQRRLPRTVLEQVRDDLIGEAKRLRNSAGFDDIHTMVQECAVPGFGKLAQYDTALRIGAWLSLLPTKIYLHQGTRDGARQLGLDVSRGHLSVDEVPAPLQELEPYEIEDFLCIYKAHLRGDAPSTHTTPMHARPRAFCGVPTRVRRKPAGCGTPTGCGSVPWNPSR